jgi:hypothetical protein
MEKVTRQEVVQEVQKNRIRWLKEGRKKYPIRLSNLTYREEQIYLYGEWLGRKLNDAGVDDKVGEAICFNAGRAMFGKPFDHYPDVVTAAWNKWVEQCQSGS